MTGKTRRFRRGVPNRRRGQYLTFSAEEMIGRIDSMREIMIKRDLDGLLVLGDRGFHETPIRYLTEYRPPYLTILLVFTDPAFSSTLFVGLSNHVQTAVESSTIDDVRPMLPSPPDQILARLEEVDAHRMGIVAGDPRYDLGLPVTHHQTLVDDGGIELIDVTSAVVRTMSIASDAEIEHTRRAAAALDEGLEALEFAIKPGCTELDLKRVLEQTAQENGAALGAQFITTAPMEEAEPGEPLPWHSPSCRPIEKGDVVNVELSMAVNGYKSQIHRSFAVGLPPTDLYEDLFAVAKEVYDGMISALVPGNTPHDILPTMAPLDESNFKSYDVMLHGYGVGYMHPFIGTQRSNYWPETSDRLTRNWTFKKGQTIVVQPNVITDDETAGLQFGTTVQIGEAGSDNLHSFPAEFRWL